jgi:SAM-dependent methyltransferase
MTDIPTKIQPSSMFRRFIDAQVRLSKRFDEMLPQRYLLDGIQDFRATVMPKYIVESLTIYDVGGGSRPCIDEATKTQLQLRLVGLDIDARQLEAAPAGIYDKTDITAFEGAGDADLLVCQSTLEHVRDTASAFRAFSTILKPNGRLLLFTPSRNAVFARINLMLPEAMKKKLLSAIFPHKGRGHDGFPAYYNRCTPREFSDLADQNGLEVEIVRTYFKSTYLSFLTPLYVVWRLWILMFHRLAGEQAAETFVMVCRKRTSVGARVTAPAENVSQS